MLFIFLRSEQAVQPRKTKTYFPSRAHINILSIMSINPAFLEYYKQTFFSDDSLSFEAFEKSLLRPLKKTLRINTNKRGIEEFKKEKESDGWIFGATPNERVFHVDRSDTSVALGSTPEHLRGDFYIQEMSASMSVWKLADGEVHPEPLRILELASSPGGKTTQLAEYYPNAYIVANEFSRDRMSSLLENIERMGLSNVAVTNMNGIQFRELPNEFDLVLLDAPCSGEGIGYKAAESLKYWNVKNVRTIARLQKKLLHAGLVALKPGGTLVYSTCTLNRMENEEVLESARAEFWEDIEVVFSKRFWPHLEVAGGFFVAKIIKKNSFTGKWSDANNSDEIDSRSNKSPKTNEDIHALNDKELVTLHKILDEYGTTIPKPASWYRYKNDILYVNGDSTMNEMLLDKLYVIRFWLRIGRMEGDTFEPYPLFGVHFEHKNLPKIEISQENLASFMRGLPLEVPQIPESNTLGQAFWVGEILGFFEIRNDHFTAHLPKYMFWK